MFSKYKKFFSKRNIFIASALIVFCVGVFLRTYNFHDWLYFSADQARDATVSGRVADGESAWPLLGPTMRKSGASKDNLFHLGPAYYYFQIISAKIFGNQPDKMAYPDLIFAILSIPLLYLLLKKYFNNNLALILTGIFSISFYAVQYARFAWNPNPSPFFVLLFLLSMHEFLVKKDEIGWIWVILAGIAIGIGVQLHLILLLLFLAAAGVVFLYLFWKNYAVWKKIFIIIIIAIIINFGQIISEQRTGFMNTKSLFSSLASSSQNNKNSILQKIINGVDCHMEAGAYILSSFGENTCKYSFVKLFSDNKSGNHFRMSHRSLFFGYMLFIASFFIFGFARLAYLFYKEKNDEKKNFLGLVGLYAIISFFVMLPVIDSKLTEFRYFIPVFFMPLVISGLWADFLLNKFQRIGLISVIVIFAFFAIMNLASIGIAADKLSAKKFSDSHSIVLGEAELIAEYMRKNSNERSNIYLIGSRDYVANFSKPLAYLEKRMGYDIVDAESKNKEIPAGKPLFYITQSSDESGDTIRSHKIENYEIFGQIKVYKLEN